MTRPSKPIEIKPNPVQQRIKRKRHTNRYTLMNTSTRTRRDRGFTLVEMLVMIAIVGILIGMLIPALQNMRELSRRHHCEHNLVQLSLALSAYSLQYDHYPIGSVNQEGPIKSEPTGFHHNWLTGLLPMLDAKSVYDSIDRSAGVYHQNNAEPRHMSLPILRCPTATDTRNNTTCYAAITSSIETPIDEDNDGVFRLNLPVSDADITDGLSYTLFLGEKLSVREEDLGWMSGTRSSLRTAGHAINAEPARVRSAGDPSNQVSSLYVGGIASDHPQGAHILMGSGEYQFLSSSMDLRVLQQMATRDDGGKTAADGIDNVTNDGQQQPTGDTPPRE